MEKAAEKPGGEEKDSHGWGTFVAWLLGILLLYFLGVGPIILMVDRKTVSPQALMTLEKIYLPLEWAYEKTWLHRPIGIYLHLWSKRFDIKGDQHN